MIAERIERWASDFADAPAYARLTDHEKEHAELVARAFLEAACERRGIGPEELGAEDVRIAMLERMPSLSLSPCARPTVPAIVRGFLESLEDAGRLAGGRDLGRQVGVLAKGYLERCSPHGGARGVPVRRAAATVGRNDPCPCGSGKKYKKCCGAG